jgi:hypothetical protein
MRLREIVSVTIILGLLTPAFISCATLNEPTNRSVTETLVLDKYLVNDLYSKDRVISPDGRHTAYFKGQSIVIDGVESRLNGTQVPYYLVFSPDSKHLAYTIQRDGKYIVVLDGTEGKPYQRYDTHLLPSPAVYCGFYYLPMFSPDSLHLAYAAQPEDGYCVVLDGVEGKHHEGAVYPKTITFSHDSKHLAYTTNIWIILDGKEIGPGSGESKLVWSPDSKQLGYRGYQATYSSRGPSDSVEYNIDYPVFSPDSQHFAYWTQRQNRNNVQGINIKLGSFIVVDGVERNIYEALGVTSLVNQGFFFTPDSQHLGVFTPDAYYVDGKETIRFNPRAGIIDGSPALSPDGKRVAYLAHRQDESTGKGKQFIVVDGKPGQDYEIGVWSPVFSPDSQHVAYAVSEYGGKRSFVVVDDIQGRIYDLVSTPVFESPNHLRYNAKKGDSLYLVQETIK